MPEHSTLVLYAATPKTNTTALPNLLGTDSGSRYRFAVARFNSGNRHSFYAGQRTTLPPLTATGVKAACGFPRTKYAGSPIAETERAGARRSTHGTTSILNLNLPRVRPSFFLRAPNAAV